MIPTGRSWTSTRVSIDSAWGSVQAAGKAYLQGVENGTLDSLDGQWSLTGINVNPANLFPEPLNLKRADLDVQMKFAPFRLRVGQMTIEDGGHRVRASGLLVGLADGWSADLDAHLNQMDSEEVLNYWPERLAPKPREWVTKNLSKGALVGYGFRAASAARQQTRHLSGFRVRGCHHPFCQDPASGRRRAGAGQPD